MDTFLGMLLDKYKTGAMSKSTAVDICAHIMAALDKGNIGEARAWFEEGIERIREPHQLRGESSWPGDKKTGPGT